MHLESHKAHEALFEIGAQIQAQEVNLSGVLQLIVDKAAELIDADVAWLGLADDDNHVLNIQTASGAQHETFTDMRLEIGRGVGGVALARSETIIVADYASYLQDTPESVRSTVTEEGLVSMICAPMIREGRMVGALYVGNRTPTEFSGGEASLVTALAGQASIAIENSQLLDRLESKNRLLELSESIHRRLTDASFERAGLDGVATTLAELLGRSIVIEQDVVPPFRRTFGDGEGDPGERLAIVAAEDELGGIVLLGHAPLDELGRRALEHGATVLAVELLRERAAQEVEWRLGGELLTELLERSGPLDRRLSVRAQRFGVDLERPHRVVVLEATHEEINERAVRLAAAEAIVPGRRAALLTSFGSRRAVLAIPAAMDDQLDALLTRLADAAGSGNPCSVGLSRSGIDLPQALREALACARFAALSGRPGAVIRADDLGALRFLFALEDPAPLHDYVDEQLGALLAHSRTRESHSIETLRAFLESDGHHAEIAARCHIHKSTVKYRLARIAEVLDRPLSDPDVRFELRLAIALADVLSALALAPPLEERALNGAAPHHDD